MKKHIFLAIGVAALVMAAREYGINSLEDLRRVLKPYIGMLDMDEITELLSADDTTGSVPATQGRATRVTHES